MKTRYGCLTLLALFTLLTALSSWSAPSADHGAAIAIGGFFALAIIYIGSGIEWLTTQLKREPRGFPVVMKRPEENE